MTIRFVDPVNPCAAGGCNVDGPRPISDTPPFAVERIVSADDRRLTVVADSGDVWQIENSRLAGVTTRHRATTSGILAGGSVGLGLSAITVISLSMLSGLADAPVTSNQPPQELSFAASVVGITAVCTALGAIIGGVVGYNVTTNEYFDFGGFGRTPGSSPPVSR